jgi:hypothetical protein
MRVFKEESFSQVCQRPAGCVEKRICTYTVKWSDPFSFQYPPECFSNVQMWRTGWQTEKEKSSFLPYRTQLTYFVTAVYGGIIKYNKRVPAHTEGENIKKADNPVCCDTLSSGKAFIPVPVVYHSKDIEPCCSLGWNADFFVVELPAVRDITLTANMCLIAIKQVCFSFLAHLFEFCKFLCLKFIAFKKRFSFGSFSYVFISSAKLFKNTLKVLSLTLLPLLDSHSALAVRFYSFKDTGFIFCHAQNRLASSTGLG